MHIMQYTLLNNCKLCQLKAYFGYTLSSRAYRPQRGRGHVTAIVLCVPSKIQIRQWFVTNYSNSCCLDCTMHTVDLLFLALI